MKEEIRDKINANVTENLTYIKGLLKDNPDIVYREFYINNWKAVLMYIDGMADKVLLDDFVMKSVMIWSDKVKNVNEIKDKLLTVTDMKELQKLSDAINLMLAGECLLFVEGIPACYMFAVRSWSSRSVGDPSGETTIRGARDGFTETLRFNTALVRRRVRDTRLRIKFKPLGTRSKTDTAMMYIDDIVNKDLLKDFQSRIDKINIDAILDSSYVEQLVEDNKYSLFPQIQSTERPDVVAAALYEGRIALIVDNSPFAIIVPATLPNLLQSPDDYYLRWMNASIIRLIRTFAIFMSIVLPALYVAVTSFHTSIIPTKLAQSIAATREGVPFPAYVEAILMEVSLAILLEAVIRLPKPIGSTIGIVGGLIIGQSAVSAGIVSPIMIIIVSVTALTNFITPNHEISYAFRYVRFLLIIASAFAGLYGIMLGLIVLLIHLVRLKSFGIPYLSPAANFNIEDFKDMFVRFPTNLMRKRPKYMNTGDKIRQRS